MTFEANPHSRDRPLVSVLMPFYNTDLDFFREAIESVICQTYPRWELLLIDDGSNEINSAYARDQAANRPENIMYLEHQGHANIGKNPSLRAAMQHVNGSLVCLLDADDYWLPNKLEEQVSLMEARPDVGFLYGNTKYWHSWSSGSNNRREDYFPRLGVADNTTLEPQEFLKRLIEGSIAIPCTCSVMVRTDIIRRMDGFDELSGLYSDQRFYVRVSTVSVVLVKTTCWDWYRQHPESMVHTAIKEGKMSQLRINYLGWVESFLCERRIEDKDIWMALRRQQWLSRFKESIPDESKRRSILRRIKKRALRLEKKLLPTALRYQLWAK